MSWEPEWTIPKVKEVIEKYDEGVRRALVMLYKQQTSEERMEGQTIERNNLGFNLHDAPFGTRLAERVLRGDKLLPSEIRAARRMLRKYVKQLTELRNAGVRGVIDGRRNQSFTGFNRPQGKGNPRTGEVHRREPR